MVRPHPARWFASRIHLLIVSLVAAIGMTSWARLEAAPLTPPTFTDITFEAGTLAVHSPSAAMAFGSTILSLFCSGGVVADFDRDGDQDIFVVVGGAEPDALYINDGTGHFTDEASAWGVAVKHMGLAAAAGDYDNDGWIDIFVTSCGLDGEDPGFGKHRLYRNTGRKSFVNVAVEAGVNIGSPIGCDGTGAAWGDYDRDGDLDLFIAGWRANAAGNRLYRNNGNGTFTNVTVSSGIASAITGVRGFSPRFVDMDGDGWTELLLAADFGTSRYFRNNGNGTFTNLTAASSTGLEGNGMGQTVGDFDNDGALDWYVTSIFGTPASGIPGTGNKLYRNVGPHSYVERATTAGVVDGGWGWATSAVDLDHDGRLDLLETNGWTFGSEYSNEASRVWMNQGNGTFLDIAATCGLWNTLNGRGLLTADFDNDGDRDVVIFANFDAMKLYRNNLVAGRANHWLTITLDTQGSRSCAPDGIGARVHASTPTQSWLRVVDGGTNYQAQDDGRVHFGVADAQSVNVRVEWPDGTATLKRDVVTNSFLTIASGERSDLTGDGFVDGADIAVLLRRWGPIDAADPTDLTADGAVDATDLATLLANWHAPTR